MRAGGGEIIAYIIQRDMAQETFTNHDSFTNQDMYVEISGTTSQLSAAASAASAASAKPLTELTPREIAKIRSMITRYHSSEQGIPDASDGNDDASVYSAFMESTHAWAVFADNPNKKAARVVGTIIIIFQLFTYWLFAVEAIGDYQQGAVPIVTTHQYCLESGEAPEENFTCEAERTNNLDALVAFFMLGIFLAGDVQNAARAVHKARSRSALAFAAFAAIEVVAAFFAAAISISQKLYIGEVTDAVEVGVGLLFIREMSTRAYHGICYKDKKQYRSFFLVLTAIVTVGLIVEVVCEALFAP